MGQDLGRRDTADLGLGGEAAGLRTGQQRKGPLEIEKPPIRYPRMRLGSFVHGWKYARIDQCDHLLPGRGFRC